ncbi:phosphate transport system permease protein PstA [Actinoplanes lobatus]|uniref:Phosphate transport system permease protein PstA n=1 Tax=Actinoplanes lobatus TaxID=113568 RepID=A0A7W7HBA3_9ACTN|nr:phosphate ABC transporter permease PstA [Actinoplanes lobatus]MBB4747410.1 phosphate transport system permease protein [Actinoplanes lobatus]GGN78967.1 phosphate transport system permease protein PstA [Actinoplanes lobatus]GIE42620.1 phosphate transport system permease protein PstA [Actinoplanes lobatus]
MSLLERQVPGVVMTPDNIRSRKLPVVTNVLVAVAAFAVAAVVVLGTGIGNWVLAVVVGAFLYLVGLYYAASQVEGRRAAKNRSMQALIYSACVLAILPLASVVWTLVSKGIERLDANFFSTSMNNIGARDPLGGAYHAIIGTLEQVGIATLMAVPLGVLGAIYLVEYGRGKFAGTVRFFVDVMTGIPSIVAGLFILSFWVLIVSPWFNNGQPRFSGFAASLALAVLMLPTIVRSTEEMLRLVPGPLREGSYALGVPQWKTILKVVLPTALPGIVTGVMLAVARAAGETAPVLLVAGGAAAINFDPFGGNQQSLSLFVYQQAGDASRYAPARAWTAALTLVALVLILTIAAKLLARRNKLSR